MLRRLSACFLKRGALVAALAFAVMAIVAARQQAMAQAANNNFANATTLTGTSGSVNGTTIVATAEAGEPSPGVNGTINSVWYRWTAPSAGTLNVNMCTNLTYDTHLAILIGNSVSALTLVGSNDDSCGLGSSLTVTVAAGTTYRIQADGYQSSTGTFTLSYSFTAAASAIAVTPAGNFAASGNQGGPFSISSPPSGQYTIQNTGGGTLNWSITSPPAWLNFSATSGSLGAGASQTITVSVNAGSSQATTFGTYSGTISVTSNGGSASRTASLTVNDVIAPTITGTPGNVSLNTPSNSATVTHSWVPPTATDNTGGSGVATFNVTLTGAASGARLLPHRSPASPSRSRDDRQVHSDRCRDQRRDANLLHRHRHRQRVAGHHRMPGQSNASGHRAKWRHCELDRTHGKRQLRQRDIGPDNRAGTWVDIRDRHDGRNLHSDRPKFECGRLHLQHRCAGHHRAGLRWCPFEHHD